MPVHKVISKTGAGASDSIGQSLASKDVTYVVTTSSGSPAVDVEIQLASGGTWHKETTGVTLGEVKGLDSPIHDIRVNVTTAGANPVLLEVLAQFRGG